jgi:DNA-directed RNA polymerase subunit RPC12/RpoP
MKNCIQCGKEFQERENKTGQEQKYCSSSCRMKAANKRREEKLINTYKDESGTKKNNSIAELPMLQREEYRPNIGRDISITDFLAVLQETSNAKIEATTERLRREYAEQRVRELQEQLEDDDDEPSGWLGKIDINNLITQSAPYVLQPLSGAIGKILDNPEVINRVQQMIVGQQK